MLFFSSEHKSTPLSSVLGYNGVYERVFELLTLYFETICLLNVL